MPSSAPSARERARQGFEAWMGEPPVHSLEVSPPEGNNPPVNPPVEVLFFVDEVDDEDDEDESTTYIATAGLCGRAPAWAPGGVELMLCVEGSFDLEELEPLGEMLGYLAIALGKAETDPLPGLLIEVGPLPVFEGMTCLLLARWGQDEQSGSLETSPPIRILSLNPLYQEEATEIVKLSEDGAMAWLDEHGVNVDDPLRDSAFAQEFAASAEQTLAAFNSQSSFEIAAAMQQMTGAMGSWIGAAAPPFFEQLEAASEPPPSSKKKP